MVEYALLAGFVAVSAGATLPGVADDLGTIYSKTQSITAAAAADKRSGSPTANDTPTSSRDPGTPTDGSPNGQF